MEDLIRFQTIRVKDKIFFDYWLGRMKLDNRLQKKLTFVRKGEMLVDLYDIARSSFARK